MLTGTEKGDLKRFAAGRKGPQVWDPFVRWFHWCLALAVGVAAVTAMLLPPTWVNLHIIAGTAAVTLVLFRILWGFLGTGAARFTSFLHGPCTVWKHFIELRRGAAPRHVGHNPLGGAMIVALMATIAFIGMSGAMTLGGVLKRGPVAFATSFAEGEFWLQIHSYLAYGLLGLVTLHLAGVLLESRRTDENLVRAMIDGRKEARPGDVVPPSRRSFVAMSTAISAVALIASAAAILVLSQRPGLSVPTGALDPLYAEECGACHFAYPPSLAPAATWSALMDGLNSHFGENAELDAPQEAWIRDFLLANSAEAFDTKAANRFRQSDPADPLRITATPFWRRTHRAIPDDVFASNSVGSRGACIACHRDAASGLFEPSSIQVPKEAGL